MLELLTLLTPSHERHRFLRRAAEWLRGSGVRRIVVDSSAVSGAGIYADDTSVRYLHMPGVPYCRKLLSALEVVETPYVVLLPDDDFLDLRGLEACVSHLQNQPDVATVQGQFVSFLVGNRRVWGKTAYTFRRNWQIGQDGALERQRHLMRTYMHQVYAVQRTAGLRDTFALLAPHIDNGDLMEVFVGLMATLSGKHSTLPHFYAARQDMPVSWSRQSGVQHANLIQMHREGANPEMYETFIGLWANRLGAAASLDRSDARVACLGMVDDYLAALPELEQSLRTEDGSVHRDLTQVGNRKALNFGKPVETALGRMCDIILRHPNCGCWTDLLEDLDEVPSGRAVWIYGSGQAGLRLHDRLRKAGVTVAGFLDSTQAGSVRSLPRIPLAAFLNHRAGCAAEPVILIASQHYQEIAGRLRDAGVDDARNAYFLAMDSDR